MSRELLILAEQATEPVVPWDACCRSRRSLGVVVGGTTAHRGERSTERGSVIPVLVVPPSGLGTRPAELGSSSRRGEPPDGTGCAGRKRKEVPTVDTAAICS